MKNNYTDENAWGVFVSGGTTDVSDGYYCDGWEGQ